MVKYKNIRVKMKGGKSRLQRVKVLASGKYKFVKNIGRKATRRTRRKSNPSRKRGGRRMARRYRRGRRRGGKNSTATLYKLIRLGALAAPAVYRVKERGFTTAAVEGMVHDYTGFILADGSWAGHRLLHGWAPYIAACVATHGIPKLVSLIRRL